MRRPRPSRGRGIRAPGGTLLLVAAIALLPGRAAGQRPVTMDEAVAAALARGSEVALARADSAAAAADVAGAGAYPNPIVSADYTEDAPQLHAEIEQPLEYPWVRAPRIRAARAASRAANLSLALARARARREAIVAYVRASATRTLADLSAADAASGERLLEVARARRQAGDASDLEAILAEMTALRLAGEALSDSLSAGDAALDLQIVMGEEADRVLVAPADSLVPPPPTIPATAGAPLRVTAAEAELRSRADALRAESRAWFPAPVFRAGAEGREPDADRGLLPTAGVSLEIPLFDRNGAAVAAARAEVARADAELDAARRESDAALQSAERGRDVALARARAAATLREDGRRVVEMTETGYREGALSIADVLEARREARDALRAWIGAVEDAWRATADWELAAAGARGAE